MKKNVLVLLILLTPINIVFSQTNNITDWLDVSENSVNSFLRKYSSNQVVKKNLGPGITVYSVSYRNIDNTDGEHTESVMFDSGIPINFSKMTHYGHYKNKYGNYEHLEVYKKGFNDIRKSSLDDVKKHGGQVIKDENWQFNFKFPVSFGFTERTVSLNIQDNGLLVFMKADSYHRPVSDVIEDINNGRIDVSKLNFYDINYLIDLFIDQFTYSYTEYYKKNNLSILNHEKFIRFLDKINNSKRNVNFDLNEEGVLGVSNSMYDDSSISLSINPSLWKTSSDSKKLYVLFHELGHDILNFRHGEGGKMMFTISESDYSFKDFYNDKDYMFKSFFKSFFN
jgi:hypothetical protein